MPTIALSEARVKALRPRRSAYDIRDARLKAFGVREKVLAWIERKKRIFLHFTPTSASWANMVERFFAILTQKQIRRGVFTSVPQLEKCLREYLQSYNENPRPLMWTKTLEEIVEKVRRGRVALPKSS